MLKSNIIIEVERDILDLMNLIQKNEDNKQYTNSFKYRLGIIKSKIENLGSCTKFIFRRKINKMFRNVDIIDRIIYK